MYHLTNTSTHPPSNTPSHQYAQPHTNTPFTLSPSHQHTPAGPIIETFLADTAAQLTYVGLLSLYQTLRERQLAIFFRNDHFSTMFSKEGQLYLLVTDLGYQKESNVVWELLDEIDGDTEYVNDAFTKPPSLSFASPALVLLPTSGDPPVLVSLYISPRPLYLLIFCQHQVTPLPYD